jgi:hypothetical protein
MFFGMCEARFSKFFRNQEDRASGGSAFESEKSNYVRSGCLSGKQLDFLSSEFLIWSIRKCLSENAHQFRFAQAKLNRYLPEGCGGRSLYAAE